MRVNSILGSGFNWALRDKNGNKQTGIDDGLLELLIYLREHLKKKMLFSSCRLAEEHNHSKHIKKVRSKKSLNTSTQLIFCAMPVKSLER